MITKNAFNFIGLLIKTNQGFLLQMVFSFANKKKSSPDVHNRRRPGCLICLLVLFAFSILIRLAIDVKAGIDFFLLRVLTAQLTSLTPEHQSF